MEMAAAAAIPAFASTSTTVASSTVDQVTQAST
jgi:hypothetical protein